MLNLIKRFQTSSSGCTCRIADGGETLNAISCSGDLSTSPQCRKTAIKAVTGTQLSKLRVVSSGIERVYNEQTVRFLRAAGEFATLVKEYDQTLAAKSLTDPLEAAAAADARPDPVRDIAAETGLVELASSINDYQHGFTPGIKPTVADAEIVHTLPEAAQKTAEIELPTDGKARIFETLKQETDYYQVLPVEFQMEKTALRVLQDAYDWLAEHATKSTLSAMVQAIRNVSDGGDELNDVSIRTLAKVLQKHTHGYGIIEDLFADPAVDDVYATAPAAENRLWIVRSGQTLQTNIRLSQSGAEAIASRLRRESGRGFSRAAPTLDATADLSHGQARVAAVADPATDGIAFAFRSGSKQAFTLPRLIANGTVSARAAGLLSTAVRRDAAMLIGGTRGAGKTTLLGSLLWELPQSVRTITIEDTPELPIDALQAHDRDVQQLQTSLDDGPGIDPTEALQTALRLGESALVLGEVRGEEAAVLYEAMRVGASGSAVLGTIHGDGGRDIKQRVTGDLNVSEPSFATTDLIVTLEQHQAPSGEQTRRVKRIEEVIGTEQVRFEPLFALDEGELQPTGRIDRGNSHLIDQLAASDETYAEIRTKVNQQGELLHTLASGGETAPEHITTAYAQQGGAV